MERLFWEENKKSQSSIGIHDYLNRKSIKKLI